MNLFLTPDARLLPGWQQAFADATAAAEVSDALLATASVIWISAGHPQFKSLIVDLRTSGRPIVALTLAPDQNAALAALAIGARGYCHALATPEMLRDVAAAVEHGGLWIGPELMTRLIQGLPGRVATPARNPDMAGLTERERETAQLVAHGLSNKEIARRLDITERTVKAHLSAIFAKLGLRDRLQLALRFKRSAAGEETG